MNVGQAEYGWSTTMNTNYMQRIKGVEHQRQLFYPGAQDKTETYHVQGPLDQQYS